MLRSYPLVMCSAYRCCHQRGCPIDHFLKAALLYSLLHSLYAITIHLLQLGCTLMEGTCFARENQIILRISSRNQISRTVATEDQCNLPSSIWTTDCCSFFLYVISEKKRVTACRKKEYLINNKFTKWGITLIDHSSTVTLPVMTLDSVEGYF